MGKVGLFYHDDSQRTWQLSDSRWQIPKSWRELILQLWEGGLSGVTQNQGNEQIRIRKKFIWQLYGYKSTKCASGSKRLGWNWNPLIGILVVHQVESLYLNSLTCHIFIIVLFGFQCHMDFRHSMILTELWLVWLSRLGVVLQTKGSLVWFRDRGHAWAAGQSVVRGVQEAANFTHPCFFPSLFLFLPFSLKNNKLKINIVWLVNVKTNHCIRTLLPWSALRQI